jgi:pescadillo protein
VNFRLYTSVGLVYPPKFDLKSDEKGAELAAFTLEGRQVGQSSGSIEEQKTITNGNLNSTNNAEVQKQVDRIAQISAEGADEQETRTEEIEQTDSIDTFEVAAPSGDILQQPEISNNEAGNLFSNFTIFISREAPRHPIEFLLRAFGCKRVAWDPVLGDGSFINNEADTRITHQIVDRPPAANALPATNGDADKDEHTLQTVKPGYIMPGRIYVQPQWVWDCVNEGKLLRPDLYAPGATLPPHLSPWVKPTKGQYDPRATLAEQEVEGEAEEALDDEDEKDEESIDGEEDIAVEADESAEEVDGGMDIAGSDDESDEESEAANENEEGAVFGGFEEDEEVESASDVEAIPQSQHQKELAAEAAGLPFTKDGDNVPSKAEKAKKKRSAKEKKEEEELERQKMMMSRKKRKLFEKMQYGNAKKDAEAEKLRGKRRRIEKSA